MHGVDQEDVKRIAKDKITTRVEKLYGRREEVEKEYGYLFKEGLDSLRTRSIHYITKWVASFKIAENVLARGKLKGKAGEPALLRRGRRGKGKKGTVRDANRLRGG